MKKMIIAAFAACIAIPMIGCGDIKNDESSSRADIEPTASEKVTEKTAPTVERLIFGEEDGVYVNSFTCGYLSGERRPPRWEIVLITNEEELAFAEKSYGLKQSEEDSEIDKANGIAEVFQDMKSKYSLDDYDYAVCYAEVPSGGHYLHADKIYIDDRKRLGFSLDNDSYFPKDGDTVTEEMGGFMHMAAIPKTILEGMDIY